MQETAAETPIQYWRISLYNVLSIFGQFDYELETRLYKSENHFHAQHLLPRGFKVGRYPVLLPAWDRVQYRQTAIYDFKVKLFLKQGISHQLGRDAVVRFECENSAIDVTINFL
jgi:hypothetical protein